MLTRGKSVDSDALVWITGQPAPNQIDRFVHSDAVGAEMAHLLDGFRHDNRADALLGAYELGAFWGRRPVWWPEGNSEWTRAANNSMDPFFWASICASTCIQRHREDVELIQVDLEAVPARCLCFAYTGDAVYTGANASHTAPSDTQWARFFHGSTRMNAIENRTLVSTYAVYPKLGHTRFVPGILSTVYFSEVVPDDYHIVDPHWATAFSSHAATLELCIDEAATSVGNALKFVRYLPSTTAFPMPVCEAGTKDYTVPGSGDLFMPSDRLPGTQRGTLYHTKFCRAVRGGSERSLIYSKATNSWCNGDPARRRPFQPSVSPCQHSHSHPRPTRQVAPGYVIASHSLLSAASSEADTSPKPFDLRCRDLCLADGSCEFAHVFAVRFTSSQSLRFTPNHDAPTRAFTVYLSVPRPRAPEPAATEPTKPTERSAPWSSALPAASARAATGWSNWLSNLAPRCHLGARVQRRPRRVRHFVSCLSVRRGEGRLRVRLPDRCARHGEEPDRARGVQKVSLSLRVYTKGAPAPHWQRHTRRATHRISAPLPLLCRSRSTASATTRSRVSATASARPPRACSTWDTKTTPSSDWQPTPRRRRRPSFRRRRRRLTDSRD